MSLDVQPPLGAERGADRIPREPGLRDGVADRDSVSGRVHGPMLIVFALMLSLVARCTPRGRATDA